MSFLLTAAKKNYDHGHQLAAATPWRTPEERRAGEPERIRHRHPRRGRSVRRWSSGDPA
jgi:hypothetical protein